MRFTKQSVVAFVAGGATASVIAFAGYVGIPSVAGLAQAAPRPVELVSKRDEVKAALAHLMDAKSELKHVDDNEKGHDYKALEYTKQAIEECNTWLKNEKE
jgi:hypothetical protein